jgi:hypothetical protein
MDLMTNMLKAAIYELLRSRGIRGSVADTKNRWGFPVLEVALDEAQPDFGTPKPSTFATLLLRVLECDPSIEIDEWDDIRAKAREALVETGLLATPDRSVDR